MFSCHGTFYELRVENADGFAKIRPIAFHNYRINDFWKLGKPTGIGGLWVKFDVKANIPFDPYLIGFYDQRELILSHMSENMVRITVEVDPTGDGDWLEYK